jgi:hypothetical protein
MDTPGLDELQDLSADDAQELRAFLDKRRWFEAKLKVRKLSLASRMHDLLLLMA